MPSSPAITASRSSAAPSVAITSVPIIRDEKTQKLQALRTPLLHLLAVRQVSVKFLAQKICCSQEDCREVLQKVGRESLLDPSKWDLSDKSFKELDVWKFPYPTEVDRQFAIDRAVSAFDRMRVSREENFWQMLLPKSERGKGKILSKLNLHSGPIQKSGTPRIHFQPTNDSNQGQETGQDSDRKDRLAPSDAEPMVRSKSHDQITKKKVSEKEAQSKRLLSKNPKKAAQVSKPRETSSVVKKGAKKAAAASSSVPKSTEFVRDSDEGEEMLDVAPQSKPVLSKPAPSKLPVNEVKKAPKSSATKPPGNSIKPKVPEVKGGRIQKRANAPLSKAVGNKPLPSSSSNSGSRNRFSDASQGSIPMTKSLSRQRTTSSPHKPSPLGSSPPTNASDFDNDGHSHQGSSTSSTPLVSQSRKTINTATVPLTANARPAPQAVQNTDNLLKRKANDIDSDIHSHNAPSTNSQTSSTKRQKSSTVSPPTSESSNSTSGVVIGNSTIVAAQKFKTYHAKYQELHEELTGSLDPSNEQVDSLFRMRDRLVVMKDEIAKGMFVE